MKKLAAITVCLGIVLASWSDAVAIDFKVRGNWVMSFGYGANSQFQGTYRGNSPIGWGQGQDNFEPVQRVQLQLESIISENLSGAVQIQVGDTTWGKQSTGGAIGADSPIVELVSAYVDWQIPAIAAQLRMGLQNIVKPAMASGNSVFNDQVAGIAANWQYKDWLGLTAFWARPYNDNYPGCDGEGNYLAGYLDNIDVFGVILPVALEGMNILPWGMYTLLGPNVARSSVGSSGFPFGNIANLGADNSNFSAGIFPAGGARHQNFANANLAAPLNKYGHAWWAAVTGSINMFDPLRIAFDFIYGAVKWPDNGRLDRSGWFSSLLFEYDTEWGTYSLYGWYGSGDDANPANGSERLPAIDPNNSSNYSHFAFGGAPWLERSAVISDNMAGTWGVGISISRMFLSKDFTQLFRINYIRGTNSPAMAQKMSLAGLWTNGTRLEYEDLGQGATLGMPGIYMCSFDQALELGSMSNYKIYENLAVCMEASYVFLWLDPSDSAWGARHRNREQIPGVKDAWNLNVTVIYSF